MKELVHIGNRLCSQCRIIHHDLLKKERKKKKKVKKRKKKNVR